MNLTSDQANMLLIGAGRGSTVHLIGAGGCGMSALGHLLIDLGHRVTGSDLQTNAETAQLCLRGASVAIGHDPLHVAEARPVLVIHTSAVREDNVELAAARALKIPVARRAVALAALMHRQRGIAVAGMHGKTTTSALLAFALEQLKAGPSYCVGWRVPQLQRHAKFSKPSPAFDSADAASAPMPVASVPGGKFHAPWFVIEADESDGTLREFKPEHAVLLNLDEEHLDHFPTFTAIAREFREFAAQVRGFVVACADDGRLIEALKKHPRKVTYGYAPSAEYRIISKQQVTNGGAGAPVTRFEMTLSGEPLGRFSVQILGEKNVSNAAAVITVLHRLGFDVSDIARAISSFRGAARRQQELYADENIRVFDDYGHHPEEIRATLKAIKELSPKRVLVAFQPHRYTRTEALMSDFAKSFDDADQLWVSEIYAASEEQIPGITGEKLAREVSAHGTRAEFVASDEDLRLKVEAALQPGDVALFLGAGGDITNVAHRVAADLKSGGKGM